MSHSTKEGPFTDEHLLKKTAAQENAGKKQVVKTWSRRSAIFPSFVGLIVAVYDDRKHVPVHVTEDVVDHRLGEFVPTRISHGHKADDKTTK